MPWNSSGNMRALLSTQETEIISIESKPDQVDNPTPVMAAWRLDPVGVSCRAAMPSAHAIAPFSPTYTPRCMPMSQCATATCRHHAITLFEPLGFFGEDTSAERAWSLKLPLTP